MNNKERKILEEVFNIHEDMNNYTLENWTNGGVNMFITIEKHSDNTLLEQLERFVDNFNIDEEIDLYRENADYKNNFTIRESMEDFEDWVSCLIDLIDNLRNIENEYNNNDEETEYEPVETLKGVGVKDIENGLEIILIGVTTGVLQKYQIIMNIKNYKEEDLFDICYEISNNVKDLYYENHGIPSEDLVKELVRKVIIK